MHARGIEAIFEDLLPEDPARAATSVLATEVLALAPDEAANYLFRAIRTRPSEAAHRAIVALLGELAARDDRWHRLVSKSLTKVGRCPPGLRGPLRQALLGKQDTSIDHPRPVPLTDEMTDEKHARRLPPPDVKRVRRHLKMTIDTEITNIRHLGTLVDALNRADRELAKGVGACEFDFLGVDHVFIGGLVVLATWCGQHRIRPLLTNVSGGTREYLTRVGFDQWVDGTFETRLIHDNHGWGAIGTRSSSSSLS